MDVDLGEEFIGYISVDKVGLVLEDTDGAPPVLPPCGRSPPSLQVNVLVSHL